jgi:tRNA A37 threonylcarbamoyladenosine dehydratase
MFSRTEILLGDKINTLRKSKVIIFGVGGVGGYAVEMLARSGVGNITLVDYDKVDITNKNRQIIALDSTIGKYKVDVMRDRIFDFYPDCKVTAIKEKLTKDNISSFELEDYDYIVDAIDMVSSKVELIKYAHEHNIPIISAMGAGNRLGIPNYQIVDIYKTHDDGLAKVIRKKLREIGVNSHKVVFCDNTTIDSKVIGSIAYFPAICGCMLSAYVIEELMKGEDDESNY